MKELLPVYESVNIICLGEGDTPFLNFPRLGSSLVLPHLYLKDERINPPGTFKARGLSTAVLIAKELGIRKIIIPTCGGTGLTAMWKAFDEMVELGWLENNKRPRVVAVKSNGCAPAIVAFNENSTSCSFWINAQILATGLREPICFVDQIILNDLRQTNGNAVAVSDQAIMKA